MLEEFNLSPNLKKKVKILIILKLTIFLFISIFESIWTLKILDAQKICIHQMRTEYINKGDKSFHQKAVNFCNGG